MENRTNYLYAQDSQVMQLSYDEYLSLQERMKEATQIQQLKQDVLGQLQRVLDGDTADGNDALPEPVAEAACSPEQSESNAETPESDVIPEDHPEEAAAAVRKPEESARTDTLNVPPIKSEIAEHFNRRDESGRLFNIFKQYYTCLNDACGGTVRVTMKDGVCSLWNYDEWEEFAYVDIHEEKLRFALHPRYTDAVKALSLCESSRLIASRRDVISVQADDLNKTVLEVLTRAFAEVGIQVG